LVRFLCSALFAWQKALAVYDGWVAVEFPHSNYIKAQRAEALYGSRSFDDAKDIFEELRVADPYRIENMDTFSNILYLKDDMREELSQLAQEISQIDQYRPETCCVVGNYFGAKALHVKAVMYFRRALLLDRNYAAAWTLLGHEYIELGKQSAVIEAYRLAIEANPLDYRAWFGLGQIFTEKKMHSYSLYYYRQAQRLRPYDGRLWMALGQTFEELQQFDHAQKCYTHNVVLESSAIKPLCRLGELYDKRSRSDGAFDGDVHSATHFYDQAAALVDDRLGEQGATDDVETLQVCIVLAEHYKEIGRFEDAKKYVLHFINSELRDQEAQLLLNHVEDMLQNAAPAPDEGSVYF
jgi:anaphase-promoting complex subunit 8